MTAPEPSAVIAATPQVEGCTGCGTQRTVLLHPHHGRQCPDHVTLPDGPFRADLAADMVELGRADRAFTYLRGWLARETDTRFARAAASLQPPVIAVGRLTAGVLTADILFGTVRRCWCRRPVHTAGQVECAEHDGYPS